MTNAKQNSVCYRVSAIVANRADYEAYVAWLRDGHIADVVSHGALQGELILGADCNLEEGPFEVVCSYRFADRAAFDAYERGPAIGLRAEGVALFGPDSGRLIDWTRFVGDVDMRVGSV